MREAGAPLAAAREAPSRRNELTPSILPPTLLHTRARACPPDCWHEARGVAVYTPIHEFELALLMALDAAGAPTNHKNAAIHLLHGVVGAEEWEAGGPPLLAHQAPDFYDKRAWHVEPPNP